MARPAVFISYRRDESAGHARAVHDALAARLGADRVFLDVEDIAVGQAFDRVLADAVGQSAVLLVLIGPRWLAPQPPAGRPRLHEDGDFVRLEVAAALARGLPVIPLLFDGAAMPAESALPVDLQPLARRQALVVDHRRFPADMALLLATVQQAAGDAPAEPRRRRWAAGAGAGAALLLGGAVAAWLASQPVVPPAAPAQAPGVAAPANAARAAAGRPALNGRWQADVAYDWPGARYTEQFDFHGEGRDLHGTASFLRVPRGIVQGQVDGEALRFNTQTRETTGGGAEREVTHRYRGTRVGDAWQLEMQTEGAAQPHRPVTMVLRRSAP